MQAGSTGPKSCPVGPSRRGDSGRSFPWIVPVSTDSERSDSVLIPVIAFYDPHFFTASFYMSPLLAIGIGPMELGLLLVVVLLLFGNRLPSVMRSMGKGIVEFKKGVQGIEDETDTPTTPTPPKV